MRGRLMFHLETRVYENGNLIRDFDTPRRFSDVMWAEKYFQYLQYLANKFYPIYRECCDEEKSNSISWFIYKCPLYLKRNLKSEETIIIYELCRAQYYFDSTNSNTTEVEIYFTMVQKRAEY